MQEKLRKKARVYKCKKEENGKKKLNKKTATTFLSPPNA